MNMKETKFAADPNKHANLPENPADHDVHHGATSDKAKKAVAPKGVGAEESADDNSTLPAKKPLAPTNKKSKAKVTTPEPTTPAKPQTMSAFDRKRLEFQVQQALLELRTKGIDLAEEGGGSYPWDECIADQTAKYGEESAANICGAIKAQNS
jgi:hypothetical protein